MDRRKILTLTAGAVTAIGLGACKPVTSDEASAKPSHLNSSTQTKPIRWNLITSWPKNFPGLGAAPERLARQVAKLTNNKFQIKVLGAKELAPALEVFDAVSQGSAPMGHSAAYYWKGKMPASPFFTAVPFGLNAQEMNAWIYQQNALELWRTLYQPYGVIPFPGGNTGVQMAGWFNKPINSMKDIKGLKMRIPGLAGEVWRRAGGIPVTLPGAELFTALKTGAIDATEWVGPYNDLTFGLHQAAKFYYGPGWHEPGPMLEFIVNESAFNKLPQDYQYILAEVCKATNQSMLDEYTAHNQAALKTLIEEHEVSLKQLPKDVIQALKTLSDQVLQEVAQTSPLAQEIFTSFSEFKKAVAHYHRLTEQAYLSTRDEA